MHKCGAEALQFYRIFCHLMRLNRRHETWLFFIKFLYVVKMFIWTLGNVNDTHSRLHILKPQQASYGRKSDKI